MIQPEVIELQKLMRLCSVPANKVADRSGVSESNWRRWCLGVEPLISRFRNFKVAAIDLAIEKGALEEGCHTEPMAQLIGFATAYNRGVGK